MHLITTNEKGGHGFGGGYMRGLRGRTEKGEVNLKYSLRTTTSCDVETADKAEPMKCI